MSQARRLGLPEPTPLLLARACAQRDHRAFRLQFGPQSVGRILHMPVDELGQGTEGEVRHLLNRAANNHEVNGTLVPFVISELSRALPELVDPGTGDDEPRTSASLEELRRLAERVSGSPKNPDAATPPEPKEIPSRVQIERELKKRVKGQDDVASAVSSRLSMSFGGLMGKSLRPKGVFLFAGPTGVGKTEMAKGIADTIYGTGDNLIRLDMSEFRERHTTARLIGPPPGYVGHSDPDGWLTTKMIANPHRVLLLDEFEKADEAVWQTFLQVFEDGRLTDGRGKTADFSQSVVVITSNIGSRSLAAKRTGFGQALGAAAQDVSRTVIEAVRRELPPELFNRLDGTFAFAPLGEKCLVEIVRAKLKDVKEELAGVGYDLTFTPAVARAIAFFEADPTLGARPAIRAIDHFVREPLVDLEPGSYRLRAPGGKVVVERDGVVSVH